MKNYEFIDMHTHLFNGKYFPLAGILRSWSVPGALANVIARVLVPLVRSSRLSTSDVGKDEETYGKSFAETIGISNADQIYERIFDMLAKALVDNSEIRAPIIEGNSEITDLEAALIDIVNLYEATDSNLFSLAEIHSAREKSNSDIKVFQSFEFFAKIESAIRSAIDDAEYELESPYLEEHNLHPDEKGIASKIGKILAFVSLMFDSEKQILATYRKGFRIEPMVQLSVLMDMDKAYSQWNLKPSHWEFREQISRMSTLTKQNKGDIVAFAAVDPFREDWEKYMDFAIGSPNNISGFKIYPPLGFQAKSISDYEPPTEASLRRKITFPGPNSPLLDSRIKEILKKCVRENIRLYAHCTPTGFEVFKGSGLNSDPMYWATAIEAYQLPKLRLFLAHGGGTRDLDFGGWAATNTNWEKTFAYRVVQMCRKYENVYCDFAYLLKLLDGDQNEKSRIFSRLKRELKDDSGPYHFSDKVCFGTDFHMGSILNRTQKYLDVLYEFFEDPEVSKYAGNFFSKNALRYLDLAQQ